MGSGSTMEVMAERMLQVRQNLMVFEAAAGVTLGCRVATADSNCWEAAKHLSQQHGPIGCRQPSALLVLRTAATKFGDSQAKSSWHRAAAQAGLTIADPGCLQPPPGVISDMARTTQYAVHIAACSRA